MTVKTNKPRKRRTSLDADRIRALLDRGKSRLEVRLELGVSKQAVAAADAARKPRGRPLEPERRRITAHVTPATETWIRAESERDGCTIGEVLDGARMAIIAADAGEDPPLERSLKLSKHRRTDAPEHQGTANGIADAVYRLRCYARDLYADARSMRESFPELAGGHAERAAAMAMAARVLLEIELPADYDLCAARARATRRIPAGEQRNDIIIARTDATLRKAGAAYEASAREAQRDPTSSAFAPDYLRARAAELHARYGELDPAGEPPAD
jgi:hypothetical protein